MESERPAKEIVDPEVAKNNNHNVPVYTEGKVTGSKTMSMA